MSKKQQATPWQRGTMTFTDHYAKPPNMTMQDWLEGTRKGRTWVSKEGELPSEFIARILKDMPGSATVNLIKKLRS